MSKPFAVFVVAPVEGDELRLATVTRDGVDAGRIGLPGGKLDAGESPVAAAIRKAAEEGWDIEIHANEPIHQALVNGEMVWWLAGYNPQPRSSWKEQARGIMPTLASLSEVVASGYGNEFLADREYTLAVHAEENGSIASWN